MIGSRVQPTKSRRVSESTRLCATPGNVAATYVYDSFGNLTASTGTITNPFQYTGREFDPETGLLYYRARYYDPSPARFLSEDPIRFSGGRNFYAYAANNAINYADPMGLCRASNKNVTNIIQSLQNCGRAGNAAAASAGDDLAQMLASGHIQVLPKMPQNTAGNTTVPPLSIFGLQTPTIEVGPDVSASTLLHEWVHKTQIYGNTLGQVAIGVNKVWSFFNAQGEGPLDAQADRIADTILKQCNIRD